MHIEKEIIRPGQYWYRDEATGQPRKLTVTPEMTKYWHEQGNAMLSSGLTVPVPMEHDFNAHPMTPAEKLKANAGWVKEYKLKGDALFGAVDIQDPDIAKKLPGTIRWTSPWINSFVDGKGKEWKNVISHLALTTRPRIVEQEPFGSIAAALSLAEPASVDDNGNEGFCLSNAGLLNEGGQPKFPIAFSMWANGIAMTTDATGRQHDERGRFGSGGGGRRKKSKEPQRKKEHHEEASDKASKASKKAEKTGNHEDAEVHHRNAASVHEKEAERWRTSSADRADELYTHHYTKAKHHKSQAESHRIKKGGGKASTKVGEHAEQEKKEKFSKENRKNWSDPNFRFAVDDYDDDFEDDDFEDNDIPDDGDPSNDDNIDLEPFGDPAGDVSMTELLCDLLGALGIQCEDTGNEEMFKRNLYNAAMTKIHELTNKAQNGDPNEQKNRANPPGQPPNNPRQPGQNPLIQQEQQPMYMSLDDIQKLDEPLKSVALSMYNQTAKANAKAAEAEKLLNSLRDAELKKASDARAKRVALLGKLSPRAKEDLEAMLAMPDMAMSMGEGGVVVDPMAQTLAVLEKGLADMPRLLTTESSALSVQQQPQDADMLTDERAEAIADSLARQMGCPPEKKAS